MIPLLASAEPTDVSSSQWSFILICLSAVAVVAVMTAIPVAMARRRGHRQADAITVAALLWGVLSAGSVIRYWLAKIQWDNQYDQLIKTGYYDPRDTSGAPAWPWAMWLILAAAFAALILYSLSRKNCPPARSE